MKLLFVLFIMIVFAEAKIVITPTVGQELTTPSKELQDDEVLMGVGIQAYINKNFAVDMRVASSDSNLMADGGRTDLERGSVNLLYDFTPERKLSPYVLAGLGYEKLHRTYLDTKSQPFYHAGAGVKVDISDNLEFVTELRYLKKSDTKDDEVIATCGFGVKFGDDECEIDCTKLAQSSKSVKTSYPKRALVTNAATNKVAKPAVKSKSTYKTKIKDTELFSDEVVASRYLLKKKPKVYKSSKTVKTAYKHPVSNYIQVAALSKKTNLKKTVKNLKSKGLKVKTLKKGDATVVLVGPYSKNTISSVYKRVKALHKDAFYKKL